MEAELNMDWQQGQQAQPNNIQIGMVRIIDRFYPNVMDHDIQTANNGLLIKQAADVSDKVLANSFLHPEKASNTTLIEVPKKWTDFFKVLLSSPTSYSWANSLLQSKFPSLILQPGEMSTINLSAKPKTS